MSVAGEGETPRTTKPSIPTHKWASLLEVGEAIEQDIERSATRLTMGGEPTFVSVDDTDAPNGTPWRWGLEKRRLAGVLFCKLELTASRRDRCRISPRQMVSRRAVTLALTRHWRKDG